MKLNLLLLITMAVSLLSACDTRVNVPPAEKDTTIINQPVEKKEEKKTETTTVGPGTTEKKTTTETKQ